MEPIGQATQFAQTAMDMANKVARQQAEDPSAFFPQELQNQAAQIQERFAENPSPMSITQTGNAGSAFSDMVGKLVSDVSVKQAQAGQAPAPGTTDWPRHHRLAQAPETGPALVLPRALTRIHGSESGSFCSSWARFGLPKQV